MGNFVFIPSFHRKPKDFRPEVDERSVDLDSPPIAANDYRIHYDATSDIESSLWHSIKNRKKIKLESNRIRTTRYNILTFIPKNLFEQFHRVANVYFAVLIALNWVPVINAISKTVYKIFLITI